MGVHGKMLLGQAQPHELSSLLPLQPQGQSALGLRGAALGLRGHREPPVILPQLVAGDPATRGEECCLGGAACAQACCVSLMIFNEQLPLVILLISEYQ